VSCPWTQQRTWSPKRSFRCLLVKVPWQINEYLYSVYCVCLSYYVRQQMCYAIYFDTASVSINFIMQYLLYYQWFFWKEQSNRSLYVIPGGRGMTICCTHDNLVLARLWPGDSEGTISVFKSSSHLLLFV